MTVKLGGDEYPIRVTSTPQGRNGMPNPAYDGGRGYVPVSAVGRPDLGQRCAGNSSCVPICPIQAKYNATKTLAALDRRRVDLVTQAVASRVLVDAGSGRVTGVEYLAYRDPRSPEHSTHFATGEIYVLAAHAVENAKLMLQSGLPTSSGLVGRNLMDHPTVLTRALMPEAVGAFRGPGSTSGVESLRGGPYRSRLAAFRIEIGNWGWSWSTGAPATLVRQLVDREGRFGEELRRRVRESSQRQVELHLLMEQLPEPDNRVTIDLAHRDALGLPRPVIDYDVSDYTRAGIATAVRVARQIYRRLGAEDYTTFSDSAPGYLAYAGKGYVYDGAGHLAGTHVMGATAKSSVVDAWQRCWDHPNLYLAGCGSFPTIGTSNPTLTMAALAFRTAGRILSDLGRERRPHEVTATRAKGQA
jgi:choline dehydrogenase-like flavoprotein